MEKIGKIYSIINEQSAYIIDEDGILYLFFKSDILDDTKIEQNQVVYFKPIFDDVWRATYISKNQ